MGSFSIWHVGIGGLLLVVISVIVIAYFLLRKPSAPHTAGKPSPAGEGELQRPVETAPRSAAHKVIAIAYLVGGVFGVITTLPQLNGVSLDLMSALAWLILLSQIAVAIYGGWQFWNHQPLGVQLLYWLSWSCVPVVSFSLFSYWCAMGLGFFPTVALGLGNFSTDFSFRFGYTGELLFNPENTGLLLGVNVVAIVFVLLLTKLMREANIPRWPLLGQTPNSAPNRTGTKSRSDRLDPH